MVLEDLNKTSKYSPFLGFLSIFILEVTLLRLCKLFVLVSLNPVTISTQNLIIFFRKSSHEDVALHCFVSTIKRLNFLTPIPLYVIYLKGANIRKVASFTFSAKHFYYFFPYLLPVFYKKSVLLKRGCSCPSNGFLPSTFHPCAYASFVFFC